MHAMSAAAKRAVDTVAAGRRVEARGGKRLSRQAWQDVRRACRLVAESERVRAVDVHGVHITFSVAPFCHGYQFWWLHLSGVASTSSESAAGARAITAAAELAAAAEREAAGEIPPWQKGGS